jgi:hypothetical protein
VPSISKPYVARFPLLARSCPACTSPFSCTAPDPRFFYVDHSPLLPRPRVAPLLAHASYTASYPRPLTRPRFSRSCPALGAQTDVSSPSAPSLNTLPYFDATVDRGDGGATLLSASSSPVQLLPTCASSWRSTTKSPSYLIVPPSPPEASGLGFSSSAGGGPSFSSSAAGGEWK